MKLIILGNYPPRQCGIGTFTQSLANAFKTAAEYSKQEAVDIEIMAMNDGVLYDYPPEVTFEIQEDSIADYFKAAQYINQKADVCILQHEYGIYGGECGNYILNWVEQLQVPLIVTLHTVLKQPDFNQRNIVRNIALKAYKLVVMSEKAREFLTQIYNIPSQKIIVIKHGVPDFEIPNRKEARQQLDFTNQKWLLTFGLLSRGKGIETVIHALPEVVKQHPDLRYLLLGKTHPSVLRREGEAYRQSLVDLARSYGVEQHLILKDDFVSEEDLLNYLVAADAYIIPYLQEAQITSGTLSYAVGAGAMIVSTPFWHAQELLSEGRGVYFDFGNSKQLAEVLLHLWSHPAEMQQHRQHAAQYGRTLKWQQKGKEYLELSKEAIRQHKCEKSPLAKRPFRLPAANFQHLQRLSDSTGILQHAKYSVPNFHEGYCLDDNARALLVTCMAIRQGHPELKNLVPSYIGYLYYMQRPDGLFKNFLSYDRRFLDEIGTEDAFGRTIWALGYALSYPPEKESEPLLRELFEKAFPNIEHLNSPRAIAYCILGLSYYLEKNTGDERVQMTIKKLTNQLLKLYYQCTDKDWQWFEESMSYNNALLPLALFRSLESHKNAEVLQVAIASTRFLENITLNQGYFRPVGCHFIFKKGETVFHFDQQPIDAMAMVWLYRAAYDITQEEHYFEKILQCHSWFLGKNDLQLPLYNAQNGGCYDGLMEDGVNKNQGAESTLAYWLSHLNVAELLQQKQPDLAAKNGTKPKYVSQQQTDNGSNHVLPHSANIPLASKK